MLSPHHERPATVTECFQRSEDRVRAAASESRHILSHHPTRAAFINEPQHLPPEAASSARDACSGPSRADILAWETTAQQIGLADPIGPKPGDGKGANVRVAGHTRPMPAQDPAREAIGFAKCDGAHAGALQAKGKSADAAE